MTDRTEPRPADDADRRDGEGQNGMAKAARE